MEVDTARQKQSVPTDTLRFSETIISTASALIGGASDMAVGPEGRLYVLDWQLKRVLSVAPDGSDPRTIGREGSGPGEFRRPVALSVGAERLSVYDRGTGRVDVFDPTGEHVGSHRIDSGTIGGGVSLSRGGRLALATGGHSGRMVATFDEKGSAVSSFGAPIVPPTTFFDLTAMKERIRRGQVPDQFRNNAQPAWGEDGSLWLVFQAEPELRHYDARGELLWSGKLRSRALEATRQAFIARNVAERDPSTVYPLVYILDLEVVGGDAWLLLHTPEEIGYGMILIVDGKRSAIKRQLIIPNMTNVGPFAVDRDRGRLYLVQRDEASVVAAPLP